MTGYAFGEAPASGSIARPASSGGFGIPRAERADPIPVSPAMPAASGPIPARLAETEMPRRQTRARSLEPLRTGACTIAAIRSVAANLEVAARRPVLRKMRSLERRNRCSGRITAVDWPFPKPDRSRHTIRNPGVPR